MPPRDAISFSRMTLVGRVLKRPPANKKEYVNFELYDYAKNNNMYIPTRHYLVTFNRDMLDRDFKKYFEPLSYYPNTKCIKITRNLLFKIYTSLFKNKKIIVPESSFLEAISSMPKASSCGYSYKQLGCSTRQDVLNKHYKKLQQDFLNICNGIYVPTFYETSPKVEIRASEKLYGENSKQRTFMCCDTLMYIVEYVLFGSQLEQIHKYYANHWFKVGFTQFYSGWNNTIIDLLSKGEFSCQTDMSHQETSVFADTNIAFANILYEGVRSDRISLNLLKYYHYYGINGFIVDLDGMVWQKNGINPSGALITLDLNTYHDTEVMLYNVVRYYADQNCSDKEIEQKTMDFYKNTPCNVFGDDTMLADAPEWDKLPETSKELGVALKFEDGLRRKRVINARFLNTQTVYNPKYKMFFPIPNIDKLYASLYFYMKKNSWRLTLIKLMAMRVLLWPMHEHFQNINALIMHVKNKYSSAMEAEKDDHVNVTMADLESAYLTEGQIASLFTGNEIFGGHNNISEYLSEEILALQN